MREIKFRVWDKSRNEMFFIDDIFCIKESKWLENMRLGYGELMQFTGLTDRNRVEIYEGDIVKVLDRDWVDKERDTKTLIVHFHHGMFELISKEGIEELNKVEPNIYNPKWTEAKIYKEYGRDIFEIIGNIYESEHLIDNTDMKV